MGTAALRKSAVMRGAVYRPDVSGRVSRIAKTTTWTRSEPTPARNTRCEVLGSCHSGNRSNAAESGRFARDIERLRHQLGVRLNFIKNVLSHLQRGQSLRAGYSRSAPGSHASEKAFQLQPQRLILGDRKRRVADRQGRFHGEADHILPRVIERNILVRLEQAELADTLRR